MVTSDTFLKSINKTTTARTEKLYAIIKWALIMENRLNSHIEKLIASRKIRQDICLFLKPVKIILLRIISKDLSGQEKNLGYSENVLYEEFISEIGNKHAYHLLWWGVRDYLDIGQSLIGLRYSPLLFGNLEVLRSILQLNLECYVTISYHILHICKTLIRYNINI